MLVSIRFPLVFLTTPQQQWLLYDNHTDGSTLGFGDVFIPSVINRASMFELFSLPEEDGRRMLFHEDSKVIRRRFLEI
jgi:hypothetical protein